VNCIESILKQTKPIEFIVINDGSNDKTKEILEHYKYNIDTLIHLEDRKGAAYCRNIGNMKSNCEYIAVCDVDIYDKHRAEAIISFFESEENKDKDIFYSALQIRNKNNSMDKYIMGAYEWDFKSKCPISHPTIAYKREVIKNIRYKEITLESDLYEFLLLDANKAGYKMGGCQNPLMTKVEGNSIRDVETAREIKLSLYKEYDISV